MKLLPLLVCVLLGFSWHAEAKRMKRRRFDLDHAMQQLRSVTFDLGSDDTPIPDTYNCDQAIDALLLQLPSFGSLFYALLNGWYLGQWADYSSCLSDATDSQYVLATVSGNYTGPFQFVRGGEGKYTNGFTTRMGLCFPKQCTAEEVSYFTKDLIKGYAEGVGWTNVNVSYHMASQYDSEQTNDLMSGVYGLGGALFVAIGLMLTGTVIEMTRFGDRPEVSAPEMENALYEAGKFRRLKQYESVLL